MLVETDFLLALAKPDDWLQESARAALEEQDEIHTSLGAYAEFFLYCYDPEGRAYEVDLQRAVANLLETVPVRPSEHEQAILAGAVVAEEHDLTPFDAIHAGVAIATDEGILTSEQDYDELELDRVPLEPG